MNEKMQAISDEQKERWNKVSNSWKKWHELTMNLLKPMGDAIIKALHIKSNDVVLDIASGTGEPAFSIAAIAKNGEVYATDLSEDMLTIARNYADEHDINNIEFKVADVSDLPFKNNFFDKISCRMGFMFFPDLQLAANEIFRVCRYDGKIAVCVWASPEDNNWHTLMSEILLKYIELPKPAENAPGMFRCAKPGFMKSLFEIAGFKNVKEETIYGKIDFGTPENYWLNRTEMSESTVSSISKIDEATREKIKDDLIAECDKKLTDGKLILDYAALIISAEK